MADSASPTDWQPIETAPKDGTRVELGWHPAWPKTGFTATTSYLNGKWGAGFINMSHWRVVSRD